MANSRSPKNETPRAKVVLQEPPVLVPASQMLCLQRNLHMDVHKVLRLPRNLHMEVHTEVGGRQK